MAGPPASAVRILPASAARILVVEDNPTQAELARLLVAGLGHETQVVPTAQLALETARSWRPAVILLDVELPDYDGFELLRRLRAEAIDSAVIVVTANASMEAAKDAIRGGAVDYLVKPFRRDRLADLLARVLAERIDQGSGDDAADAPGPRVLVVEDNPTQAMVAASLLRRAGNAVRVVGSAEAALEVLADWRPEVMLLDVMLPGMSGLDLLRLLPAERVSVQVIVVTAQDSTEGAAEAIRLGAFDYVAKPYDGQRLTVTVRNALRQTPQRRERFHGFIGAAALMQGVYSTIESVAASRASVFITGESGTGKELAAEAVHRASPRGQAQGGQVQGGHGQGQGPGPFVALNCGAIPRDLLESEVFGHVKGAFTGATNDRAGAARLADGGTLFLDEIAEMPLEMQVKLLRFVQTGTFQQVGSGRTEKVDVRFVCATNRDPMAEVQAGRFREDLFYRLYVVPVVLPPLRERGDDVVLIARHFLTQFAREERRRFRGFTAEVERILLAYPWPGNVRQLQNVVRNIVVLHDGERVDAAMLPPPLGRTAHAEPRAWPEPEPPAKPPTSPAPPVLPVMTPPHPWVTRPAPSSPAEPLPIPEPEIMPLAEMERRLILAALRQTQDDVPRAAALLQVNPSTIYRRLQAWRA
jgi:two-component system repressor protein LuxO